MAVEQRLKLLALGLAHRIAAHALGGRLVFPACKRLDLDADLLEKGLHVVRLRRKAEQRDRRLGREEDALGRRGDVELAMTSAARKQHDHALALVAQAEQLLAKAGADRPARVERRHDEGDTGNARVPDRIVSEAADRRERGRAAK